MVRPDRADVAAAERSRQERLGYARTAAMAARATLRSLVERTGSADAATGADVLRLRARLAAVQEYLDRLTEPPLPGTDDDQPPPVPDGHARRAGKRTA